MSWAKFVDQFPAAAGITIIRLSPEESKALADERLAKAWTDNHAFADKILAQIEQRAYELIPEVQNAAIAYHERFALDNVLDALRSNPHSLSAFEAYELCASEYYLWMSGEREWPASKCFRSVEHPSISVPRKHADHLRERGFWCNSSGWFEPRGAAIRVTEWRYLEVLPGKTSRAPKQYKWIDTAGLNDVYARYDALFHEVMAAAATARAAYREAYDTADASVAAGKPFDDCPFSPGSIPQLAWDRAYHGGGRRPVEDGLGFDF